MQRTFYKKRTFFLYSVILFSLLAILSCKKIIHVDLNNAAPRIVIEGVVTNLPEPYQVRITKTVNFTASNAFPPITGALVQITDSNSGLTATLLESDPGVYTTNLLSGIPLHTYKLLVQAEGKEYKASSTMPHLVPFDSVTFSVNTDLNNKKVINAVVNFQDPPGLGNYYQFTEYLNEKLVPNVFVFEDRLSDGRYIEHPLFNDSSYIQRGDTLLVKMFCIDKPVFDYFYTLIQVTGNANFQTGTPANPNTNISNGALGYFSAHTIQTRRIQVY